jgi:indole-3-glycerol phosphate synthase
VIGWKLPRMINTVPDILARIVDHKALELKQAAPERSVLERRAEELNSGRRDFAGSLRSKPVAIIAEIKKASPSKGLLCADFHPAAIAAEYEAGGAGALSILTDQKFFQGSLDDLQAARAAVNLPALRKDFTIDQYHVVEAAANGADAILLIAAILTVEQMRDLRELAARYRMAALVEVHDEAELASAIDSGAEIIGVNNRNLRTFEVTLNTSLSLAERIPPAALKVSESGIESRAQIDRLRQAGFDAFLIGEHLIKSGHPREALRKLTA